MVNTHKWSAHRSLETEIWIIQVVNVKPCPMIPVSSTMIQTCISLIYM